MTKRNIETIYPLTPMQQGMLFHSIYAPDSRLYFEQLHCTLRGELDISAFHRAWQRVIERHAVLRTAFTWRNLDKMFQVVHKQVSVPVIEEDWRAFSSVEQAARLDVFQRADRERGFDLARAPLLRLALLRLADDAYAFIWSHHHLLLDGWSLPLLLREVFTLYEGYRRGRDLVLEAPRQYRDYIQWLGRQDLAQAEVYWRQALKGFTAPTPLGVARPALERAATAALAAEDERQLTEGTTQALQTLARQNGLTLSTLLQGAWALLLHRYSGEEEVLFGATVSGRPPELPGVEQMVGLFINSLPIRVRVRSEQPILAWLQALQAQVAEMRQFEYSPLVEVQGWSDVPRDRPLFDSLLIFENYPVDESLREQTGSLRIEDVQTIEQTNYPLNLISGPGRRLTLKISYDTQRFAAGTIDRMLGHLQTLLEGIAAHPESRVADLPLLTEAERQQLTAWSCPPPDHTPEQTVVELFEAQVARTPSAAAGVFIGATGERQSLTYFDLNRRANQLAHFLRRRGVGPERLVAIGLPRSLDMLVALLAVLKAGGAYLPLDPDYPAERLAFMLADAGNPLVLTHSALRARFQALNTQCPLLTLDSDESAVAAEPESNPERTVGPSNLAYVIYTSGSTGLPKGVLLEHGGLSNFLRANSRDYFVGVSERVLQFASMSFDASIAEIFSTLLNGHTLVLAARETLASPAELHGLIRQQAITLLVLPPSMLAALSSEDLPQLRTVLTAGETCPMEVAERWARGRRLINAYGPTETTIGPTSQVFDPLPEGLPQLPMGRPIPNTQVYVLDAHRRPVPVGVAGEIYVGGVGVARGYLNRPELTAEKFIEIREWRLASQPPASTSQPRRVYRTGDLARWRADGMLEFLGRADQQVKVRGYRIELGEIEAALAQHPAVRQAVVVVREVAPNDWRLLACLLPQAGAETLDLADIRQHLKARLPEYMQPNTFVVVDAFPLMPNGKVDRRALPSLAADALPTAPYAAPHSPTEEVMAELWARVLKVGRIGVNDSFFDLGGHSLLATQLISRVRETFGVEIAVRALFESPTVAGLSTQVEAARRSADGMEAPPLRPQPREAGVNTAPLSFAQQRLWFLDQLAPGNLFFNVPAAVRLSGHLAVSALQRALAEIVRRHETLRTTFRAEGGVPVQVIAPADAPTDLALPLIDLTDRAESEREAEALRLARELSRQPFDLARGPLLRAALFRLSETEHIAVLVLHHIISDAWSIGVLVRELGQRYRSFVSHPDAGVAPAPLPIQFADFARWQRDWLQGEVLDRQLAYWKEKLAGLPPVLELPTDRLRPAVQTYHGATARLDLPASLLEALTALSREAGATLFMTLLAAYQVLLARYSGQYDFAMGTAIANRQRAEVEPLIGMFVNTLVLRADLSGQPTFREVLQRVRETALGAYAHQDLPFEMLVDALQVERNLSHSPLFQVAFALQNTPFETLQLPGLSLSSVSAEAGAAQFDLLLTLSETPHGLSGGLNYNTDLFDEATAQRMLGHYATLLTAAAANPEERVSRLPVLTERERRQVLEEWNQSGAPGRSDRCAHQLFEGWAERQPDSSALGFGSETLSYGELNAQAEQLAQRLRELGVGPETVVGLCVERSFAQVVGVLGVWKAGGAYLPLDPHYPAERLAYMLEDSGTKLVLTQAHLADKLRALAPGLRLLPIDNDWERRGGPTTQPVQAVQPSALAYVIYTSGSTGRPKGVLLRHAGLCNLADAQRQGFDIQAGTRILQFAPLSFDASVWEMVMALCNGGELVLAQQETLVDDLAGLLREARVNVVTLPPSVLNVLESEHLPDLRVVVSAGEACSREIVARWATGRRFFNAYGPTETTVCASWELCDPADPAAPTIGRPILNTQLYILDQNLQPVPVGVPGELCIAGISLAEGYLNRPELTAERFLNLDFGSIQSEAEGFGFADSNPQSEIRDPKSKIYKTGDLCRYRPDGRIEFLGRLDQQVKVRGFRIELGEIEVVLRSLADVQDAAVMVREDMAVGDRRLVAYVVLTPERSLAASNGHRESIIAALRDGLRRRLPEYMIPAYFVLLEAFPLSPNGKIDRRRLPAPELEPLAAAEYVAPRTEVERRLAEICAGLLGLQSVGVHHSFFDLGGHSLLATQLISRVRETFQVELPLRALFEQPTVAGLAELIEQQSRTTNSDDARIAALLAQVEQLSDDAARDLLAAQAAD